jgi:response regulator RpfG family c-di-GMP phosphodiesterase
MDTKILFVDDEASILGAYQLLLGKQFRVETAVGGKVGLTALETTGPYAVVVADMQMPEMTGLEYLMQVEALAPDTVRIMLTGNLDQETVTNAVNKGHVFRFLNKPCPRPELVRTLNEALTHYRWVAGERELLEKTLAGSVKLLSDVLSLTDPATFGQAQKLREYMRSYVVSQNNGHNWEFEIAAILSQVGLVAIPASVVHKVRQALSLTGLEKDMWARVPEIGADLVANIPRLNSVSQMIRFQNKHFDGSGLPAEPISGEKIPAGSRILKVLSDLLELETSGTPRAKALTEMKQRNGWYDPSVLDSVFKCLSSPAPSKSDADQGPIAIRLGELQIKHVLAANIVTAEGMLLISTGTEISRMMLEKLRNLAELNVIKEPIYIAR